jgi:hypothetical protein
VAATSTLVNTALDKRSAPDALPDGITVRDGKVERTLTDPPIGAATRLDGAALGYTQNWSICTLRAPARS